MEVLLPGGLELEGEDAERDDEAGVEGTVRVEAAGMAEADAEDAAAGSLVGASVMESLWAKHPAATKTSERQSKRVTGGQRDIIATAMEE